MPDMPDEATFDPKAGTIYARRVSLLRPKRLVPKRGPGSVECQTLSGEPGCRQPVATGSPDDYCAACRRVRRQRERDARRAGLRADG